MRSGFLQGARIFVAIALTYLLILHAALAPIVMPAAGSPEALLSDAHILCLTESAAGLPDDAGLPAPAHDHCNDCCLSATPAAPPVPVAGIVPQLWPRAAGLSLLPPLRPGSRAPPEEAWSPVRAQRGPPKLPA